MYIKVYRQYIGEECVEFEVSEDTLPETWRDLGWEELNDWLEENYNGTVLDDKYIEIDTVMDVEVEH